MLCLELPIETHAVSTWPDNRSRRHRLSSKRRVQDAVLIQQIVNESEHPIMVTDPDKRAQVEDIEVAAFSRRRIAKGDRRARQIAMRKLEPRRSSHVYELK